MENDYRADYVARPVVDGRRRIFDGNLKSVAAYQDAVLRQSDRPVFLHRQLHRVWDSIACHAVNNPEDLSQWHTRGLAAPPAGHGLRDEIEKRDIAGNVRAQHGVTDGAER